MTIRADCTDSANVICHHTSTQQTLYVDFTAELLKRGTTLSSATIDTSADATLSAGAPAVNTAAITDTDAAGNSITIAIGKAIQFSLSGGTVIAADADPQWIELVLTTTLADSTILGHDLRLKVT